MKNLHYFIISFIFLLSCNSDNEFPNNIQENSREEKFNSTINLSPNIENSLAIPDSLIYLKNYLIDDLDFNNEDIAFTGENFILQADMEISIAGLKYNYVEYQKKGITNETAHYASSCGLYSPVNSGCIPRRGFPCDRNNEIYEIYVIISPSLPSSWHQATIDAMDEWSNLTNNRINFVWANPQYCDNKSYKGIKVFLYSESNTSVIARAALPDSGDPGYRIRINTNSTTYNSTNQNALTRTMVHEFGHTIGYRHTNETDGCFISGSATVDNNSIMNSILNTGLFGFSNADMNAHNILYPTANANAQIIEFKSNVVACEPF